MDDIQEHLAKVAAAREEFRAAVAAIGDKAKAERLLAAWLRLEAVQE
jgi:hypothetical protein